MVGEFLREAGLLLAVLLPLDALFSGKTLARTTFVVGMAVSAVFLILGVTIERLRP
jgi:ABC-type sugar transport system permease subunit